ncbi:MAG: DegT/DnrJ/EryC1/StrS family aminotransferase [Acidobacteriaceae bacterium]|nr:DegT/DnrJ/EryC1/StrS family aminotransferase [Acidobacteriaceae bacterium]
MPYIGDEEIAEVIDSLRNGFLTAGPKVKIFEAQFADFIGTKHAIAVNSCTAALELALAALDIGPGDEVIVPTLTFCATANVVEHRRATTVLVDVGEDLQIDAEAVERAISHKTRAVIPVHYGGQACDLKSVLQLANRKGVAVIQDAAHSVGTEYDQRKIGADGLVTAFSFYPSKNMTTGEGGMLTTSDNRLAERLRVLSLHGIRRDSASKEIGPWLYEIYEPGYKAKMTDLQASIGIHQLRRLEGFISRRREIAQIYSDAFKNLPELVLPVDLPGRPHAYHLYTVRIVAERCRLQRDTFIQQLKKAGIGSSVHFIPLHRHPYYRDKYEYPATSFPVAEAFFPKILSLPLYPKMSDGDVLRVISAVRDIICAAQNARHCSSVQRRTS